MPQRFTTQRRVEFRDTDAAGIMHFASIIALMEEAEHAFLRSVAIPLFQPFESGHISWPRVSTQCDFQSPARFEDVIDIHVTVERLGKRSVTYRFDMECDGRAIATGTMTAACCYVHKGRIEAVPIPETTREALEPFCSSSS